MTCGNATSKVDRRRRVASDNNNNNNNDNNMIHILKKYDAMINLKVEKRIANVFILNQINIIK